MVGQGLFKSPTIRKPLKRVIEQLPRLIPAVGIALSLVAVVLFLILVSLESNTAPEAIIDISNSNPRPGTTVYLDGTNSTDPDGDELTYHWDLPENTSMEGGRVEFTFRDPGNYTVILEVRDSCGNVDTDERIVNVG
jgi:hypothetical protein